MIFMEKETTLEAARNNLKSYTKMWLEYEETIDMLKTKLASISYKDKLYSTIDDELDETIHQATQIKSYIDYYKNFIKEHENGCNINEVNKSRPSTKA